MARGSQTAQTAATSAQNISNTAGNNAQALFSTLAPELEAESAAPSGFSPFDISAMNTSAVQAAGGSAAGAVGQGGLQAARTRNIGGSDAAIAESMRGAGRQLSQGVLGTQIANARLKQSQMEQARNALQGLYSANLGSSVGALGQVASNVNADTNAENASWDWTRGLDAFSRAANAGASFIPKGGG